MKTNEQPEAAHIAARRLADTIEELCARADAPEWAELADVEDQARTLRARIVPQIPRIERALVSPEATEQVRLREGRSYYALLNGARSLAELCDIVDGLGNAHDDGAVTRLDQARRPAADAAAWLESAARETGELLIEPGDDEPRPCLGLPPHGAAWDSARDVLRAGTFLLARAVVGLPIDRGLEALMTDRDVLYRQVDALRSAARDLGEPDGSPVLDRIGLALVALEHAENWLLNARPGDFLIADRAHAHLLEALSSITGARLNLVAARREAGPELEPALAAAGRAAAA